MQAVSVFQNSVPGMQQSQLQELFETSDLTRSTMGVQPPAPVAVLPNMQESAYANPGGWYL